MRVALTSKKENKKKKKKRKLSQKETWIISPQEGNTWREKNERETKMEKDNEKEKKFKTPV